MNKKNRKQIQFPLNLLSILIRATFSLWGAYSFLLKCGCLNVEIYYTVQKLISGDTDINMLSGVIQNSFWRSHVLVIIVFTDNSAKIEDLT